MSDETSATSPESAQGPCGKVYVNLRPDDLQKLSASKYVIVGKPLLRRALRDGVKYIYVVTLSGQVYIGDLRAAIANNMELHHPDLVDGEPVAYAGEVMFYKAQIIKWNHWSGHYEPNREEDSAECIKRLIQAASWGTLPEQLWVSF